MAITQRIFVEDGDEHVVIDTESEELNIRVFWNDTGGGMTIVVIDPDDCSGDDEGSGSGDGGDDSLVVVKNFRRANVTGTTSIDISQYARKFIIDQIIMTLVSGTPTTIKAGWSAGADEVCFLTDIADLITGIPKSISVKVVPPPTGNVVHFTIPGATYTIDLILIRYKL